MNIYNLFSNMNITNFSICYESFDILHLFDNNIINYIINDFKNHCGLNIKLNSSFDRHKLRRSITEEYYNKSKYYNKTIPFYKYWNNERLERAHYRQNIINTTRIVKFSYGYLLYDLINNSYKDQIYFRINNSYNRYKEQRSDLIYNSLKYKLDKYIITDIISYIHITFNKKLFNDRTNTNFNRRNSMDN